MALRALAKRAVAARSVPGFSLARGFAKASKKGKGGGGAAAAAASASASPDEDGAATLDSAKKNMTGAVLNLTRALAQMRPGRADAGIFDELHVQAYGQRVALPQLAQVSVAGAHALSVMVYDPSLMRDVRAAVEGMNPVFSVREEGGSLEISFPKMTKETRGELLKAAKKQAELARQHVRRARQDAMGQAKKLKEAAPEDDVKRLEKRIQSATDDAVAEIGKLLSAKEKDLEAV